MPNIKKNRTTDVSARCTKELKEQLSKKLIACGYCYPYKSDVLANFTDFLEALNSKDLEWFEKNFKKGVDT
ncbi:MAG: hypothetical protein ACKPE3_13295 [Sphaerospermopsis kisseleviana]